MSISLVAGLGNPGRIYAASRHNLGWVVIDAFAAKLGLQWRSLPQFDAHVARWDGPAGDTRYFLKPLTFMNESGRAVGSFARYHKILSAGILAVYDDVNIDLGLVKVSVAGSAGGHNGVSDLLTQIGEGFVRFRLGVGPKPSRMELKDFVLGNFTPDQQIIVNQQLSHYLSGLELLLSRGTEAAMNQLNRRESK
jgi:PTH1 family peptidyl-tRNA hydrolase